MTDNQDGRSDAHGNPNPGVPGGYPQQPYGHQDAWQQQPEYAETQRGYAWGGQPEQQVWGAPEHAGYGAQPQAGYPGYVAGQQQPEQPGYGQPQPEYAGYAQPQPQFAGYAPGFSGYGAGQQQAGYGTGQPGYPGGATPPPYYGEPQQGSGYGQPPTPPPRNKRLWVILAAVAAVIVLIGSGITAFVLTRNSSDSSTTAAPSSTGTTAPTGTKAGSAPTSGAAPKSGLKTVTAPTMGIAYDVPAGFTVSPVATTSALTGNDGMVIGYGRATEGDGYCPGSAYRTLIFVAPSMLTDPAAAATNVTKIGVEGGYSDPTGGKPGAPTAVTTASGITGQQVEASGAWKPTISGCTTSSYSIYTFAFTGPQKTTLALSILADRGTQGELPADQAKAIIASLRTAS